MFLSQFVQTFRLATRPGVVAPGSGARDCGPSITVDAALAAEAARYAAQIAVDVPAMERLFGDDLRYTHSSGLSDTKATYIEAMRSQSTRYHRMTLGDVAVRCYGGLAILTGDTVFEVTARGQDMTLDLVFHAVWVQRSAGPQFVSWQSTRRPAKP